MRDGEASTKLILSSPTRRRPAPELDTVLGNTVRAEYGPLTGLGHSLQESNDQQEAACYKSKHSCIIFPFLFNRMCCPAATHLATRASQYPGQIPTQVQVCLPQHHSSESTSSKTLAHIEDNCCQSSECNRRPCLKV